MYFFKLCLELQAYKISSDVFLHFDDEFYLGFSVCYDL